MKLIKFISIDEQQLSKILESLCIKQVLQKYRYYRTYRWSSKKFETNKLPNKTYILWCYWRRDYKYQRCFKRE